MKKTYKFLIAFALAGFTHTETSAQEVSKTKTTSANADKNTTVIHESKPQAFTSEKQVNGKTIQIFTSEQFDKLPKDRKEYYTSSPGSYEITNQKDN